MKYNKKMYLDKEFSGDKFRSLDLIIRGKGSIDMEFCIVRKFRWTQCLLELMLQRE